MKKYIPALKPSGVLDFVALNTMLGLFCANDAWIHGGLWSELNTWRLTELPLDCPLQDITHWPQIQKKQKNKAVS